MGTASRLPFDIREAMIQVSGRAFWLKGPLRSFYVSAGVPSELFDRYADESKYKITRNILSELDAMGDEGWILQRRILTEMCRLRKVPDENVPDKDAAISALRGLKELAVSQRLAVEESRGADAQRAEEARRRQDAIAARARKMGQLRTSFNTMITSSDDPQKRGYGLEDLLAELFEVNEIPYRRPYRTAGEQIDGHFEFKGFDYLVEARWRAEPPSEADLAVFKTKVDKKIASTRGLFVTIAEPRADVVSEFTRGVTSNIVLLSGWDLTLILEGYVSLADGVDLKVQKAAQEGVIYFPLARRFGRG